MFRHFRKNTWAYSENSHDQFYGFCVFPPPPEVRASFNEVCHKLQYTRSAVWAILTTVQDREKLYHGALPRRMAAFQQERATLSPPASVSWAQPALIWWHLWEPKTLLPSEWCTKMSELRKLCLHIHFLLDWRISSWLSAFVQYSLKLVFIPDHLSL